VNSDAPAKPKNVDAPLHENASDGKPRRHPDDDALAMRAALNVQRWKSYLPDDCVRTMIEMGWDRTT
jgi:hypothetical protein